MPSILFDPQHWLVQAGEARKLSEQMTDPAIKRQMETIAKGYERIALHAAEQAILKDKFDLPD